MIFTNTSLKTNSLHSSRPADVTLSASEQEAFAEMLAAWNERQNLRSSGGSFSARLDAGNRMAAARGRITHR